MAKKLLGLLSGETFRYLVFGVLTVVVNMVVYHVLVWKLNALIANTIAFFVAVLFAYWTNSTFVFRVRHTWRNFLQFIAMRIGTLVIDNGGMLLLVSWEWNDFVAKGLVNAVIIVVNYLVSKLLIFKKRTKEEKQ